MATDCSEARLIDFESRDNESQLDMTHVAECRQCAELLAGHKSLLGAFQGEVRVSPSIHFDRNLRNRLQEERHYENRARLRSNVMRTYWLVATVASLAILRMVPWAAPALSTTVLVSIGVFLGLAAIVPSMFYRKLRFG